MPGILTALVGLVLAVTSLTYRVESAAQQQPPASPTGTAALSGVVTDAVTGRPIAGAAVSLYGVILLPDGRPTEASILRRSQVLTDVRGRFVFTDLPATHRYSVFVSRAGYAAGEYEGAPTTAGVRTPLGNELPIHLTDGEWMRDANVRLRRASAIGGRVMDERGEPVVGAAVRVFSRRMLAGHERLVPGPVAATDDRGAYRLTYLQPGRYYVAVLSVQATVPSSIGDGPRQLPLGGLIGRGRSAAPVARAETLGSSIDVDGNHRLVLTNFATPPPPGADRPRVYAPVFYPNATTADDAQAVDLAPGAIQTDVDFQLAPVSAVRISGQVTGAVQDATNMILRLMPRGYEHLGAGSEVATTMVEADRRFVFLSVPAGNYTLLASPGVPEISGGGSSQGDLPLAAGAGPVRGYSMVYAIGGGFSALWWRFTAGAGAWGRLPLSVGNSDISGVDLALQPAGVVRGRVVFDDPAKADPAMRFTVMLEPANGDPSLGLPNATTDAGDTTYAVTIAGVQSGRYLVRVSQFRGWRVKSVTVRGIDVTDSGIEGVPGREYDEVVVTVTNTATELTGFVRDASGRPATGAVILFPIDPNRWVDYGLTPDRLQSVTAARDGSFKLTAHRDGEYFVIAVPRSQSDAWWDPKFLAAAAPKATRISLKPGAPNIQNLQMSEVIVK